MTQYIKVFATSAILIASFSLFAQPSGGQPPHREDPCKTERQTYCKDSRPGPESDKCLKDSIGKLSESCKTHVLEMLARFEKFKAACGSDEEKYCQGADNPREKMSCLKNNESKLSVACKAALPPNPPDRR
ncbi:hypothetical protein [Leptospira wolffii]|uniref:hypothetical protein n=1 Tax=Leptospira wolffii TaxID=409998 RepID=UPI0002FCDF34|nr:hypothetical protein [Leptospira wolffii]EPG68100.1 hypothetical protein LEP1GSC061_0590 [Leptospira wolffii serovar Khorat str. Khorat-H2]